MNLNIQNKYKDFIIYTYNSKIFFNLLTKKEKKNNHAIQVF